MKYKHLQAKTSHNIQRNAYFRDPLREACEGRASARCGAKRSTEAIDRSDSVARSTPTLWAKAHKGTPKKLKFNLSRLLILNF
ncbi:MAG: hypothetical protein NZ519_03580 [Bacteroidia bacterium]|nr:hypothetical protein [Bacteroidia bacterium]